MARRPNLKPEEKERFSSKFLLAIDEKRRAAITAFEQAQARRNAASKEIGEAKKAKDDQRANALMAEVNELKTTMPALEDEQKKLAAELDAVLAQIPNTPLDEVPDGTDEHGNVEYRQSGAKRSYAFTPKQHFELGEDLKMMDFELAAKLSGARFVVLQKGLARLERALGQLFLDMHTQEHGYTEVNPPLLVRDEVMFGTAQLPKFEEDQFAILRRVAGGDAAGLIEKLLDRAEEDDALFSADGLSPKGEALRNDLMRQLTAYWLIPTAEVPLTNLVRETIRDEAELPIRVTAYSPCFRAEAGAAGKDTRGMIRQHQFSKVELVSITTPEQSAAEHERMTACAEEVLKRLGLAYRTMLLSTGDMGFASRKTTTSRCGCRARTPTARSPPAPTAATSRPGA
jgi:seryl-tRNA synthetase